MITITIKKDKRTISVREVENMKPDGLVNSLTEKIAHSSAEVDGDFVLLKYTILRNDFGEGFEWLLRYLRRSGHTEWNIIGTCSYMTLEVEQWLLDGWPTQ